MTGEQMALDFQDSVTKRNRAAVKNLDQLTLFSTWIPNIDISLYSGKEAVATITANSERLEQGIQWLKNIVGALRPLSTKRFVFPAERLHKLAWIRPPANVTLDANARAVACAQHAEQLGLKPLKVISYRNRISAESPRGWPAGFKVKDAGWDTIFTCIELGIPLDIAEKASAGILRKLDKTGSTTVDARLTGSSLTLQTGRPQLLEKLGFDGLSYVGDPGDGLYRLPLLLAKPLLNHKSVNLTKEAERAIRSASKKPSPLLLGDDFPWTLWDFQAKDAGAGLQILETTGGVLFSGEMGTGKTTIALAVAHHMDLFPLLVVAPLSAFSTWERQLGEMGKSTYLCVGNAQKNWEELSKNDYDAIVISFDRLGTFDEILRGKHFEGIIADELQRIRTPGSRRSRAIRAFASAVPYRIGLSGTPLVNGLPDLLSQGAFLVPSEWPARASTKHLEDIYPGDPIDAVTAHLGSVMVRRKMTDVGKPMPKRIDRRIYVQITAEQRKALADLEEKARQAKEEGEFDGAQGKFNALVKLGQMRKIISNPRAEGVGMVSPKVKAACDTAEAFVKEGRFGVIFANDMPSYRDITDELNKRGIRTGGISGAVSPEDRIEVEKSFHRGEIDVVMCTAAGAESWSASPRGTWVILTRYPWVPSEAAQSESRVYRLNSDLNGPAIEVIYLHAVDGEGPTIDARMLEILNMKKELFSKVIDLEQFVDNTDDTVSVGDLLYMLTGEEKPDMKTMENDALETAKRAQRRKEHAKNSLHRKKIDRKTAGSAGTV